jgi:hypothetical protein
VLEAAGETETTQEKKKIQDWLELGEGDPGLQLMTEEEIPAVIYSYLFSTALHILFNLQFTCFQNFLILCL